MHTVCILVCVEYCLFFFSSRRRHTRFDCDWSSDVCSSDLMVIEPRGLWEHNAYQTDTQFVLEVKPIQYDPNKLVQGTRSGYSGEKLSLNFQNVEVRSVLNVIADFTDLNIITSDSVGGNLTLRLKDVPWDQA